jgi:hypothetical protein
MPANQVTAGLDPDGKRPFEFHRLSGSPVRSGTDSPLGIANQLAGFGNTHCGRRWLGVVYEPAVGIRFGFLSGTITALRGQACSLLLNIVDFRIPPIVPIQNKPWLTVRATLRPESLRFGAPRVAPLAGGLKRAREWRNFAVLKTQSPDTTPEAERVQIELVRRMPGERKLQLAGQFSASMRKLMRAGIQQRHPNAGPEELEQRFVELWLGPEIAPRFLRARALRHAR